MRATRSAWRIAVVNSHRLMVDDVHMADARVVAALIAQRNRVGGCHWTTMLFPERATKGVARARQIKNIVNVS